MVEELLALSPQQLKAQKRKRVFETVGKVAVGVAKALSDKKDDKEDEEESD